MPSTSASTEKSLETLRPLLRPVEELIYEIWETLDAPDYGGSRWLELYRGTATDDTFICVDFSCNALHVSRDAFGMVFTYIPGWFYEVATRALTYGIREDCSTAYVKDLQTAAPLRFRLSVVHELAEATQTFAVSRPGTTGRATSSTYSYKRLPYGYEFEPAHAFGLEETAPEAKGFAVLMPSREVSDPEQVRWSGMKLRIVAAPGVEFSQDRVISESVLADAREIYVPHFDESATCTNSLKFELERRQQIDSVPGLGARWRPSPLAEGDLVVGKATSRERCALALEQARPDGVDILLARPAEPTTQAPWIAELSYELARAAYDTLISWQGGIPREAPLPIRIRIKPASAEDRFSYRIQYLDSSGNASSEPTEDVDEGKPCLQLSVIRTEGVSVFLDSALSDWGESELERIVEYREHVVHFDDVVFMSEDTDPGDVQILKDRPATIQEILNVVYYIGAFTPLEPVQALYDLEDCATLGAYLLYGTDVWGEEMTPLNAGITLGGLVLPEAGERVIKKVVHSRLRLRTVGDDPFARIARSNEAITSNDLVLVQELLSRTAE